MTIVDPTPPPTTSCHSPLAMSPLLLICARDAPSPLSLLSRLRPLPRFPPQWPQSLPSWPCPRSCSAPRDEIATSSGPAGAAISGSISFSDPLQRSSKPGQLTCFSPEAHEGASSALGPLASSWEMGCVCCTQLLALLRSRLLLASSSPNAALLQAVTSAFDAGISLLQLC